MRSDGTEALKSLLWLCVPSMLSFVVSLCFPAPPAVSVLVFSCLCYRWCCCVWEEQWFWRDLGFERRCSPDDSGPLDVWTFAVTVLTRQAGAGDRWPLALTVGTRVCLSRPAGARGPVAAAVGVHPGEKVCVCRPTLVEAVVAWHGASTAAHLDEGVALGVVARYRDAALSGPLRNHLLLEWS